MKGPSFKPKVILGVAAHPDDLDFGAAGTMAKFSRQGADVYYLILTEGSKGSADLNMTAAELVKLRRQEQLAAAKLLGVKEVYFLSYEDGALEVTQQLKKDICRYIRELRPDTVITMDPSMIYSVERGFINHPDHRAAGQATLDAVFPLARDHLSFPELYAEGHLPHKVKTLLLVNFDQQNFSVDITDTIEAKLDALAAHASQISDVKATQKRMRQLAAEAGEPAAYDYAEAFLRIEVSA